MKNKMIRREVSISDKDYKHIKKIADRCDVSVCHILRIAVKQLLVRDNIAEKDKEYYDQALVSHTTNNLPF